MYVCVYLWPWLAPWLRAKSEDNKLDGVELIWNRIHYYTRTFAVVYVVCIQDEIRRRKFSQAGNNTGNMNTIIRLAYYCSTSVIRTGTWNKCPRFLEEGDKGWAT